MTDSNYGIKTSGDDLNWRNLNNDHEDNPVVTALMKNAEEIYSNIEVNENTIHLSEDLLLEFHNFLIDKNLGKYFEDLFKKKKRNHRKT